MTTQQGAVIADGQNWLTVGPRGPQLLEDHAAREKIFHFDHERIPERVVHACGYGAKGVFECYDSQSDITQAGLFGEAGKKTEVFARFSTVGRNKGSADLARDVRGFAVKFHTEEGTGISLATTSRCSSSRTRLSSLTWSTPLNPNLTPGFRKPRPRMTTSGTLCR